jgi:hypothetical protein
VRKGRPSLPPRTKTMSSSEASASDGGGSSDFDDGCDKSSDDELDVRTCARRRGWRRRQRERAARCFQTASSARVVSGELTPLRRRAA